MSRLSFGECIICQNFNSLLSNICTRCRLNQAKNEETFKGQKTQKKKTNEQINERIEQQEKYNQEVLERIEQKKKQRANKQRNQKVRAKHGQSTPKKPKNKYHKSIDSEKVIREKIVEMLHSETPVTLEHIAEYTGCHKKVVYNRLKILERYGLKVYAKKTIKPNSNKQGVKLYWFKDFYVFHETTVKIFEYLLTKDNYQDFTQEISKSTGVSDVTIFNRYLELQKIGNFLERKKVSQGGKHKTPYVYRVVDNPLDYRGIRDDLIFPDTL